MEEDIICSVVENVAGEDVLPLVDVLKGKKNVSEFTLAEELKEEINTIRNKLYRLYDSNLVEFTRKKDKKKGWYIYYWTFVPSRIPFIMKELKRKELQKLKEKLKREQNSNFFECKNRCMRLTFDQAIDHQFKCPECGELMNQEDNATKVQNIIIEIDGLEKDIIKEYHITEQEITHDGLEGLEEIEEIPQVNIKQNIPLYKKEQKIKLEKSKKEIRKHNKIKPNQKIRNKSSKKIRK